MIFPQIKINRIFILIVLCLISFSLNGLAQKNDLGTWIDVEAIHENTSIDYGFMGEFYTKDHNKQVERVSVGCKGDYFLTTSLKCGVGYLLMNYFKPGYTELRNRVYFQSEFRKQFSNWNFSMRERMQITLYPETTEHSGSTYSYWRNRLRIEYKNIYWHIVPVADFESFYLVGKGRQNEFDEFRYSLGVSFIFAKKQKVKIYGMLSDASDLKFYILGLAFDLNL
jgi:hypothetical protein